MSKSADNRIHILGITTGDPAGIGPEVSLRAAVSAEWQGICRLLLFGDAALLRDRADRLSLSWEFEPVTRDQLRVGRDLPRLGILDVPAQREEIAPGQGSKAAGASAARNILECEDACRAGVLDAMVTAPLNKKYFQAAGYSFPGHTEFLAHLSGISRFAMAFLTERLKVVLVTIHLPLRTAIEMVTGDLLLEKLEILLEEFPRLGLPCARVGIAGLNPHAGEGGLLGSEERERLEPALQQARRRYPEVKIEGPVPADTLFYRAFQGEFDAVLALYHDQGLTPIKLVGFGEAANVTLGLPYVRTSVDHGTAYEIASRGCARPEGMISAIRWALRLIR